MRRCAAPATRVLIACAAALALLVGPAAAQDVFTGTLEPDADGLRLRRCDLAGSAYRLRDADPVRGTAVADFLADQGQRTGVWVADVIGEYEARGDAHGLAVLSMENLRPGPSCHLLDAIDALEAGP